MREIKFKGMTLKRKKWVYGYLASENFINEKDEFGYTVINIVKVFTSGKWRIGTVIYSHSEFTIDVTKNKELEYGRTSIIENFTEVIGNIYENKDLLEKEGIEDE